nr:hypothetical protein SYMBAF_100154 [Serratia symbiotica]
MLPLELFRVKLDFIFFIADINTRYLLFQYGDLLPVLLLLRRPLLRLRVPSVKIEKRADGGMMQHHNAIACLVRRHCGWHGRQVTVKGS